MALSKEIIDAVNHAADDLPVFAENEYYDFFSTDDSDDHLTFTSPEEAIEEYLSGLGERGQSFREVIDEWAPITVYAYDRTVPDIDFAPMAQRVAAATVEFACDEMTQYGYAYQADAWKPEDLATFTAKLEPLIEEHLRKVQLWKYEVVGERTYSQEELLKMFVKEIKEEDKEAAFEGGETETPS